MLPRDLDDRDYKGREHIHALLSMKAGAHGHGTFVNLAHHFLSVIGHAALLDCLSVDTAVGGLYNFMSGSGGTRAIPFFQRLNTSLIEEHLAPTLANSKKILELTLVAMSTVLRELLRREQRAAFHDELPDLVESMATSIEALNLGKTTVAFQLMHNGIRELRGMVSRATGLLQAEEEPKSTGVSTSVVTSTYP